MADVSSNEDAAVRYILGECSAAERSEFEARLATSAELRALVGKLEEGAAAVAIASPRRRPPTVVWQEIEKNITRETQGQRRLPFLIWFRWISNGWTVAAICLIGWLLYAFWESRTDVPASAQSNSPPAQVSAENSISQKTTPLVVNSPTTPIENAELKLLQARTREIAELQKKIAQLEAEATRLSQSLARQSTLLNESNRIKFYQLTSAGSSASWKVGDSNSAPMSTDLQRAMLMAVARELGWVPKSNPITNWSDDFQVKRTTMGGIDFVDLPGTNSTAKQTQLQSALNPDDESSVSTKTIPASICGSNLVVAVDSTVVPPDSTVTLTVTDANQNQMGGTFVFGENPTVVTIPMSAGLAFTPNGYLVIGVSSVSSTGVPATTQFYIPANQ